MKKYTDQQLSYIEVLTKRVINEGKYQVDKFGVQKRTLFEWYTITAEEFGELAKGVIENEYNSPCPQRIIQEAIQVATLAIKIAMMIKPKPPLKRNRNLQR